jgi:hypothetical protein
MLNTVVLHELEPEDLSCGSQTPPLLQTAFDGLEDEPIHQIPECNDEDHYRDDLAHVIQIAPHHEQLA